MDAGGRSLFIIHYFPGKKSIIKKNMSFSTKKNTYKSSTTQIQQKKSEYQGHFCLLLTGLFVSRQLEQIGYTESGRDSTKSDDVAQKIHMSS